MDPAAQPPESPGASPETLSYRGSPSAPPPPTSPAELTRGTTVDRYVVLDRVGEGGMGIVYAAYDPSLDRRVALKFLNAQDGGDGVREKRLLREAQAMARLSHPNVAVAYEVGIFHRHVFLAMEFVDGVDLRQWLADGTRSFLDILEAFRGAGHGLVAAHAAGLIHRDFKPANVLIDRRGRPRVTDFGLSRHAPDLEDDSGSEADGPGPSLSSPSHLSAPLTRTGGILGTPSYMAPEQREGGVVDARSDQFSFCVALYEALYGEHPFAGQPAGPDAVPAPPSSSSPVPRWCRQAVMRGLSAAREERFPTMDALLMALVPPAGGRRPVVIASSIAVGLAAAAGILLALTDSEATAAPRCDLGAQRLAGVWDAPRKQQVQAAFLQSGTPGAEVVWKAFADILDRRASAWIAMNDVACKATHIDHVQSPAVLDLRVECLDRKRDEIKAVVDVFGGKLETATVDGAVGAAEKVGTVSACADVANLRAVVPLPEDPIVRDKVRSLRQRLDRSRVLYDAGQFKSGIEYMEGLVREAASLAYAPLSAEATHALGFHLTRLRPADAEKVLFDAASLAVRGRDWRQEAEILVTLVANYARAGRPAEGSVAARMAELAVQRGHGDDALGARLANNTGMVEAAAGRQTESLRKLQQAKQLLERSSDVNSSRFAIVLFNIADKLRQRGSTQEALRLLETAQQIQRSILRPDHPDHQFVLARFADAYVELGQFRRARGLYEESLRRLLSRDRPDQVATVVPTARLAQLSSLAGDHTGAREQHNRLRALQNRLLDEGDVKALDIYMFDAEAAMRAGRYREADTILHEAMARADKAEQQVATANALQLLGTLHNLRSRFKEALGACRRSLEILRTVGETWNPNFVVVHECIGEALLGLGDAAAARKALEPAVTPELDVEKGPQWTAGAKLQLARALWATGDKARAVEVAHAAHRSLVGAEGDNRRLIGQLDAWLKNHRAPAHAAKAAAN